MYYIHNVCCLCLQNTKDLKRLSDNNDNEVDNYKKLKLFLLPKVMSKTPREFPPKNSPAIHTRSRFRSMKSLS